MPSKLVVLSILLVFSTPKIEAVIHGRYTKNLNEYRLTVPHKLTANGDFSTFNLPHFHDWKGKRTEKRSVDDPEMISYGIPIESESYHLDLWPNRDFIHPNLVIEKRQPKAPILNREVREATKKLCHYRGMIRGIPDSKAAISTCDGLAGYIILHNKKYFIEPVDEHQANSHGHHLHVLYHKDPSKKPYTCGTTENWEEGMRNRLLEEALAGNDLSISKRTTESINRYMELAVVCDKTFLHYHKVRDVELYIMTVMNMVSDYFHEPSVGNQLDVVIVRIIYLEKEEEEIDLRITKNAKATLNSFCHWALKLNTPVESQNHFDIALLLTRYDLCMEEADDCQLTGLATVGGACSKTKPCAISEDMGLVLGVVATHELGHLLGSDHDQQETPCPTQDVDGSYFLMAPIVNTYTIRWSSCSMNMMRALLDNNLGECLNDMAESVQYPFSGNMPGVVYDADEQCKFIYPKSEGQCSSNKESICEKLMCKKDATSCITNGQMAASGTKCGEKMWCFNQKCVEMGSRPAAINGGWGEWSPWSECSRTCGGGVLYSERQCDSPAPTNGGRYCLGERRKEQICNPTPCDSTETFRQEQCTEHNSKLWKNEHHNWTAHFMSDDPCALYCMNEKHVFTRLENMVQDATPCKAGTKNVCISGICRDVGCDNILESEAVEDRCGVCNGDGSQCKIIEDTFKDVGQDYTKVVVIPAGARRIEIIENAPSSNMIAITDSAEKKFYLNGDYKESDDAEITFSGTTGLYSHPEPEKEELIIFGPTKEDLVLFVVFFAQENHGYIYKWAEPTLDTSYEPRYHWEAGEFQDCSVRCGGGIQETAFNCVEEQAGKVSDNFCIGLDKPQAQKKNCHEQPCKMIWTVGAWGTCRACKNRSGVRVRSVECIEENPRFGSDGILVEDHQCDGVKPAKFELCENRSKCGKRHRTRHFIPGNMQQHIWKLMRKPKRNCIPNTKGEPRKNQIINDFMPIENDKIVQYNVIQNPLRANLSDKAEEEMGDLLGDVVDNEHTVVYKGWDAVKLKMEMEGQNDSLNSDDSFYVHSQTATENSFTDRDDND